MTLGVSWGAAGCGDGRGDRVATSPTLVAGAEVRGAAPRPFAVALRTLTVNGWAYGQSPHAFRSQTVDGRVLVRASPTSDPIVLRLLVG